ncbi:MAG: HAMP domain-containing sensor histidine kinase [Gammaproteobacteria bacterium]
MKKKRTSTSFNWAISFIIFIPLVISLILSWVAYMRIHDFESNQKDIAHSTIERAGEDISNIIDENRRLVRLFASDEHAMIARLASNTDNLKLREQLQKKIKRFFPHSFAFTIADSHGNPLLDDFDGYIGDICIEDMRNMISTRKYAVRIHTNPYVYHYDSMATWHDKNRQRARILDMVPVKHSMWHLTDLAEPGLFNQFRMRTYRTFGMIIVAFILIAVTFSIVLVHFERKRQQAESMRDEMLSLFSHDLRSPLIGIKGAMELLKEHSATIAQDKREHLYRLIHEYVMHMGRIVDDILDVYKLESGKMSFHFEKIPLSNLIKQAIAMVTGYAEQFNVQLEVNNDTDDTLLVRVDQQRLIRCLTNLLTNALKFSPVGGTVVIRTSYKHGKAIIAIQDHGPGIPQSLQPHIFQKFVQSRKLQVHNLPSTGLGLTIVKYIAEAHGGRVYFETSPGNGTCFYLELPVVNNSDTSLTG